MNRHHLFPLVAAAACVALSGAVIPGDAQAGATVFTSQKCVTCHSVQGKGGSSAPDLGKRTARGYTPVEMAALMWNHAPSMWSAMEKAGVEKPKLSVEQSADLFAYFFAARYFDTPGDAGRGRKLFVGKGCSDCHNITGANAEGGRPVMSWQSVADPIELARQMWNHAGPMHEAMSKKKLTPPQLTAVEMNDIIVYLQNLPQTKSLKPEFAPASAETGETLFKVKGCAECHKDVTAFAKKAPLRTMADFASVMWNHSAKMNQKQSDLRPEEMKRLVGYLWAVQFSETGGDMGRGKKVFTDKGCSGCHNQGFPLKAPVSPYNVVAALWAHGPDMQKQMATKKVAWPRFEGTQMADLLTFANGK